MIFFETERLILRQLKQEDAQIMFDYRNNEICSRYQRGQTKELDKIRELISERRALPLTDHNNCIIAVSLKETDEMVGEIVVMPNDGCFSLGYTFSYKHHRKGYAFEALKMLTDSLHDQYPEMEFICFVEPENLPSIALLQKLGYTDYGYVEKITSNVFGKWIVNDPLN